MDEMDRGRKAPKKRPNLLVRLLAFLVTVALVVGAVFLVANYDKLNFDALKRWFAYRDLERGETGQSASFAFEGGVASAFGLLGGDLLVCSGPRSGFIPTAARYMWTRRSPWTPRWWRLPATPPWSTTWGAPPCSSTGTGRRSFPCPWRRGSSSSPPA